MAATSKADEVVDSGVESMVGQGHCFIRRHAAVARLLSPRRHGALAGGEHLTLLDRAILSHSSSQRLARGCASTACCRVFLRQGERKTEAPPLDGTMPRRQSPPSPRHPPPLRLPPAQHGHSVRVPSLSPSSPTFSAASRSRPIGLQASQRTRRTSARALSSPSSGMF